MNGGRGEQPVRCGVCGITCSNRPNLRRHAMQHTGERPHLCQHCGDGFIQRQSLQDHLASYHPETIGSDPSVRVRQCPDCGQVFYRSGQLQRHVRTRCGTALPDRPPKLPIRTEMEKYGDNKLNWPYACKKCNRRFKLKASLIVHDRVHSNPTSRTGQRECPVCGARLSSVSQFYSHMRGHGSSGGGLETSYPCDVCGKQFNTYALLESHTRVHTGERPFPCSVCGRSFAHYSELQNHVRVHTDERPFECTVCGKRTRQYAHLRAHMRTHTGERPFACQMCSKSYKNLVDLRLHCRRVHHYDLPKREYYGQKKMTTPLDTDNVVLLQNIEDSLSLPSVSNLSIVNALRQI